MPVIENVTACVVLSYPILGKSIIQSVCEDVNVAGIFKKKKGVQKNQGASMGACLIEIRNDTQFELTMQKCTTNMMSTHNHTEDLINMVAWFNHRFNGSRRESVMMDNACVTEE